MRLFGYPYNDLVICKDSPDYLVHRELALINYLALKELIFEREYLYDKVGTYCS